MFGFGVWVLIHTTHTHTPQQIETTTNILNARKSTINQHLQQSIQSSVQQMNFSIKTTAALNSYRRCSCKDVPHTTLYSCNNSNNTDTEIYTRHSNSNKQLNSSSINNNNNKVHHNHSDNDKENTEFHLNLDRCNECDDELISTCKRKQMVWNSVNGEMQQQQQQGTLRDQHLRHCGRLNCSNFLNILVLSV